MNLVVVRVKLAMVKNKPSCGKSETMTRMNLAVVRVKLTTVKNEPSCGKSETDYGKE